MGIARWGTSVLEDVALAHNIKRGQQGDPVPVCSGGGVDADVPQTGEMVEGWTKNLALLFPKPMALAAWRVLDVLLFFGLAGAGVGDRIWWCAGSVWVILLIWVRTLWRFYRGWRGRIFLRGM